MYHNPTRAAMDAAKQAAAAPAKVEQSPEAKSEPVAADAPDFKPHSKWSLQDVSYAGVITKPAVAEYKKTPGSLNAAVYAAAFYAKRDGVDMAVIEGNSYGSSVYQIQGLTKDIAAVTVMRSETSIVIAKPDGKLYKAKAVPVAEAVASYARFDAAKAAVEAGRVYVKLIKSVAGGWIRTFGIRDGDTVYQRPDVFNPTGAEPADNGAWAAVTMQEFVGYIDYIEKKRAGVFYDAGMRLLNTVKNADEIIANGKAEAKKRDDGMKAYEAGASAYNNAPEVDPKSVEIGDTFTNHLGVKYKAVEVGNYGPVFVKEGDPEERQVTLGKLRGTLVKAAPVAEPVQPQFSRTLNPADFTYRYEGEAIAILNAALEADEIRKVDFEAVKSSVNRAIDMQRNEIQKEWLNSRDKDAATYPLEEEVYYTSVSLNTLNSAKKKAMKAQGTYIGDAVLKLVSKYEPVGAALEELKPKIVTRQVKTEEQKAAEKSEKLIPKTAASAALFIAIDGEVETKRPAIVADIKAGTVRLLKTLQKRRGDSLASMFANDAGPDARKDEGIFGSELSRLLTDEEFIQKKRSAMTAIERKASAIKSVPPLEKIRLAREIAAQVEIVDAIPVLDDAKMEEYANREVDEMFAAIKVKMLEKAGEIESPKVEDLSHYQFAITGQMKGRTVRIEQDIIINRSANGKAFNQFPARIYVDGKFTSEADYKTMMTA